MIKTYSLILLSIILAFFLGVFFQKIRSPNMPILVSVSAEEFKEELNSDSVVILDIRSPEEFNSGRIAGAINIDFYGSDFRNRLDDLDKNKPYKIYCNSGNRTSQTMQIMEELGFTNVTELSGGIKAWASAQFPICIDC